MRLFGIVPARNEADVFRPCLEGMLARSGQILFWARTWNC